MGCLLDKVRVEPTINQQTTEKIELNDQNNSNMAENSKNLLSVSVNADSSKKRTKSELGKGYSLMDWIRFSNNTPNLSGVPSLIKNVTFEELSKHNTVDDCWIVLFGKVYNITPYMKYHPGGVEELMRGAGINATDLFNQIHPWVNFHSMLEKCLVGVYEVPKPILVSKASHGETNKSAKAVTLSVPTVNTLSLNTVNNMDTKNQTDNIERVSNAPAIDTYNTMDKCVLVIYTKYKKITNEFIVIDKIIDTNELLVDVYIESNLFEYIIELPSQVTNTYDIKIINDGKVEIILYKIQDSKSNQTPYLFNYKVKQIENLNCGINFRQCELINRLNITHDTDLYTFRLPKTCRMRIPCGRHVLLRLSKDSSVVKPYTPLHQSLFCINDDEAKGYIVSLMIKHYEYGALTSQLKKLKIGEFVEISNFMGTFDLALLENKKKLYCICAGTGLTPMVNLLYIALEKLSIECVLVFYNKTEKDILWHPQLNELSEIYKSRVNVYNILSDENVIDWTGLTGRISKEFLQDLIPLNVQDPLFCICGPVPFTKLTVQLLDELGYKNEQIYAFLS